MDADIIEDCLQRAAELSTVWAVVREQNEDGDAWIVVLEDESLLDVEHDPESGRLVLRTKLGQITQADTRAVFNDLLVRCASAFELPRIGMGPEHRYELLASWPIDPMQIDGLTALLNRVTTQARAWRDIVARPLNLDGSPLTCAQPLDTLALKA
ncbi:hypothetical protein DY262_02185 [Hydrogenophaga borbori]|uniref:Type III secretion system chaperone n=1 Tax=Hydrogenophaga borbori TaxID=2294117 RepID=A0A372EQ51_9BURK|nr:type III secretion system chaperone [Hydrogenophaga borbori]RFP82656.1 hypothetical protein DY262_02185 [Hydrogenophaga borbori]